jgi:hypothetical protein
MGIWSAWAMLKHLFISRSGVVRVVDREKIGWCFVGRKVQLRGGFSGKNVEIERWVMGGKPKQSGWLAWSMDGSRAMGTSRCDNRKSGVQCQWENRNLVFLSVATVLEIIIRLGVIITRELEGDRERD